MNDAAARRRNQWINHIGRHAHAKPDAVFLRFEGRSTTWARLHSRVTAVAAAMSRPDGHVRVLAEPGGHGRSVPRRLVPLR